MLGYIILIVIFLAAGFFIWRKWGESIKKFLNLGSGTGKITEDELTRLDGILQNEKEKAHKLTEKATLAEKIRNAKGEIAKERKRQTDALNKIAGRTVK
ncbi:MAG: hypothetical protein WC373_11105 [Smithella sp.]|jgi:hypothetical protein